MTLDYYFYGSKQYLGIISGQCLYSMWGRSHIRREMEGYYLEKTELVGHEYIFWDFREGTNGNVSKVGYFNRGPTFVEG